MKSPSWSFHKSWSVRNHCWVNTNPTSHLSTRIRWKAKRWVSNLQFPLESKLGRGSRSLRDQSNIRASTPTGLLQVKNQYRSSESWRRSLVWDRLARVRILKGWETGIQGRHWMRRRGDWIRDISHRIPWVDKLESKLGIQERWGQGRHQFRLHPDLLQGRRLSLL